mgnify:CR=1 FL=1
MFTEGLSEWTRDKVLELSDEMKKKCAPLVDKLGVESGIAQELNGPITSLDKLGEESADTHMLLVMSRAVDGGPVGFIKYGVKNLFFYSKRGVVKELSCTCVLDFYVSTVLQRSGIGGELFRAMLDRIKLHPNTLAYDRPSPKLIAFLSKQYGLVNSDLQPNRFAIFPATFMDGCLND